MNRHDVADQEVVPAQFIAFGLACALGLLGGFFPPAVSAIAFKLADAVFITGCVLVAMKLARKGWDLPAAGYTVLSIAWGVFFLAKDFRRLDVGNDIFASAFYFLLPSLVLIVFYQPFPRWIKALTLLGLVPSLTELVLLKSGTGQAYEDVVRTTGYQLIHLVSLVWGAFFYWQYRREVRQARRSASEAA
ncbi:hypothetical protein [Hymenobacter terricola]|uniref:hypothetical protein n=1 Tax=Hymenobacter terricola TaxID=2819236 RepID=UPI001B31307F|nr:hypothetical protein [Hymenobacter terricola]